jgi:hypothetical protein
MFRGRLLHFRSSGFKAEDLLKPASPPPSARPSGRCCYPEHYSMFKTAERKEFSSHRGRILVDNRPTLFDAKKGQIVSWNQSLPPSNCRIYEHGLMLYSDHSAVLLRPDRPRRGGRAAECGGLLNRCTS